MGADFLCVLLELPTPPVSLEVLRRRARNMPQHIVDAILEEYDYRLAVPDSAAPTSKHEDAAQIVIEALEEIFREDGIVKGTREAVCTRINGVDHLVSGGLSWGDVPTSIFDPMAVVVMSQVTDNNLYPTIATL